MLWRPWTTQNPLFTIALRRCFLGCVAACPRFDRIEIGRLSCVAGIHRDHSVSRGIGKYEIWITALVKVMRVNYLLNPATLLSHLLRSISWTEPQINTKCMLCLFAIARETGHFTGGTCPHIHIVFSPIQCWWQLEYIRENTVDLPSQWALSHRLAERISEVQSTDTNNWQSLATSVVHNYNVYYFFILPNWLWVLLALPFCCHLRLSKTCDSHSIASQ